MSELFPIDESANGYRVLARKYRPATFEELIGQEALVRTLSNAIETGRLPHAWILTGVRGIGKTTTARIIARALNCTGEDGKGGPTVHPCGKCDSCRAILEDRHVDILEMDAASRTGVDDIRDIIEGVKYGPVSARYKIYILDEVHMLSKNAFNALLKTLEEPPPHTKFIFATTEGRKVPVTVLSRCQRFDLRRVDSETLTRHFTKIAGFENATTEEEAVKLIAHAAEGSVRDGLSLLDQAISRGNGTVTAVDVKDMLGLADRGQSMALFRKIMRGEMKAALDIFASMQLAGSDPLQVLQDMCNFVHLLTRGQVIPDFAADESLPEYDRRMLTELSDIKIPPLARAWQILLKGINEVQLASNPAQAAEMVLIRLAYASDLPTPADLVKQLRDTPPSGGMPASSGGGSSDGAPRAKRAGGATVAVAAPLAQPQVEAHSKPMDFRDVVALFAEKREAGLHALLHAQVHLVRCEAGVLEVRIGDAPPNFAGRIGKCLTEWTGQRWVVSISPKEGEPTLAEQDREIEALRIAKAKEHPLMRAVFQAFPAAKVIALRQRELAQTESAGNDVGEDSQPPETEDE